MSFKVSKTARLSRAELLEISKAHEREKTNHQDWLDFQKSYNEGRFKLSDTKQYEKYGDIGGIPNHAKSKTPISSHSSTFHHSIHKENNPQDTELKFTRSDSHLRPYHGPLGKKYITQEHHDALVKNAIDPQHARLKPFTLQEINDHQLGTTTPKPTHDLETKLPLFQPRVMHPPQNTFYAPPTNYSPFVGGLSTTHYSPFVGGLSTTHYSPVVGGPPPTHNGAVVLGTPTYYGPVVGRPPTTTHYVTSRTIHSPIPQNQSMVRRYWFR